MVTIIEVSKRLKFGGHWRGQTLGGATGPPGLPCGADTAPNFSGPFESDFQFTEFT